MTPDLTLTSFRLATDVDYQTEPVAGDEFAPHDGNADEHQHAIDQGNKVEAAEKDVHGVLL